MSTRHYLKESKRRLKTLRPRLSDEAATKLQADIEELEAARAAKSKSKIDTARKKLYADTKRYMPKSAMEIVKEYVVSIGTAVIIALAIRHFIIEPFKIPSGSMIPTLQIKDKILVVKFIYGPTIPFSGKRLLWQNKPNRWDIVVFTTKDNPKASDFPKNFVKRVVGLPGEELEIKDGQVYVNGKLTPIPEDVQANAKKEFERMSRALSPYSAEADDYQGRAAIEYTNVPGDRKVGYRKENYLIDIDFLGIHLFAQDGTQQMVAVGYYEYGLEGQTFTVPEGHYFVMGDNSPHSYDSRGWGFVPYKNIKGKVVAIWWPLTRIGSVP